MVIALDGPAGSGKSTLASMLAKEFNCLYVNSGSLYRLATYLWLETGDELSQILERLDLGHVKMADHGVIFENKVYETVLRSAAVDQQVGSFSSQLDLRQWVNGYIRSLAQNQDLIVEGRDMTSEVFADSPNRFYLDASPEIRARRRVSQQTELDFEQVLARIQERDSIDASKAVGALKQDQGVVVIDTSPLTIEQVCERVAKYIRGTIPPQEILRNNV